MQKALDHNHDFIRANGTIDQSKLEKHLHPYTAINKDKSVVSPSTQNTKLCKVETNNDNLISEILSKKDGILKQDKKMWFIIDLLINSGCRISEILQINACDILSNGSVKINALKGGHPRIISSSDAREYLMHCKMIPTAPFQDYNRFFVYRQFKKWGIRYVNNSNHNVAVTHAFRHINTKAQRDGDISKDIIQKELGHTNTHTQTHYGRGKE